jgi:hypothetical protein
MRKPLDPDDLFALSDADDPISRFIDHADQKAGGLPFVDLLPGQAKLLGGSMKDDPQGLVLTALHVFLLSPECFPDCAPVLEEVARRQGRAMAWQELICRLETWLGRARSSYVHEQATAACLIQRLIAAYQEPDAPQQTLAERLLGAPPTSADQLPWIRRQVAMLPILRLLFHRQARRQAARLRRKAALAAATQASTPAAPAAEAPRKKGQRRRTTTALGRQIAGTQVARRFLADLLRHK